MTIMRVLLDANIFISYLLNPHKPGAFRDIMSAAFEGGFTLLLPEALLAEFVNKIPQKPFLAERIHAEQLRQFTQLLNEIAEKIPVIKEEIPAVIRDPKDDYLLAYAMVGEANYLVTGDEDLLVLGAVGPLDIIKPRDFVTELKKLP